MNINDIAKLANVSKATVSRVINNTGQVNEKTRKHVLEIIEKYNYHPNSFAQAISTQNQQTGYIAVIIPHSEAYIMSNPVYAEIFRGISEVLTASGYYMLTYFGKDETYIKNLYLHKRVSGYIFLSPTDQEYGLLHQLADLNAPLISTTSFEFKDQPKLFHVPYIDIDNYQAALLAMEHLLGLGHERIAFLSTCTSSTDQGKLAAVQLRQNAYSEALLRQGIAPDPSLITVASNISLEAGYDAMEELLKSGSGFTAVFCCTDLLAIGALKAIKNAGISVPAELSIIGFDGIPWTRFTDPTLTTIGQKPYVRGVQAAKSMISLLQDGILPEDILCRATFIKGDSTAPPAR